MRCWITTCFCFFPIIIVNLVSSSYIPAESTTVSPKTTLEPSYDANAFVVSSSRIFLTWDLGRNHLANSTISFSARYRSSVPEWILPMFDDCRGHEKLHYCEAISIQYVEDSASVVWSPVSGPTDIIDFDCDQYRFIEVKFNKLKLPGTEYEFILEEDEYIAPGKSEQRTCCVRATTIIDEKPKDPPKIDAGSFQVLNSTEKTRTVKVYWRKILNSRYTVEVYEEDNLSPVFTEKGPADKGWIVREISLKRHHFICRTFNTFGVSDSFSVVNVPPQDQILPTIVSTAVRDATENSVTLSWDRPEGIRITNYTIFWIDNSQDEENPSIYDSVHVPAERTLFKVYLVGPAKVAALGLSANTESSSTGMLIRNVV